MLRSLLARSLGLLCSLLFLGVAFHSVQAAGEFVTTWKTDNAGITDADQIRIPVYDGLVYNYHVGWGDGTYSSGLTASTTHTYAAPGTYTVSVSGTFPGIGFILSGDREKILSVDQWGTNQWQSMGGAFFGCTNLRVLASDAPDLSQITDLTYSFRSTNVSEGFANWDVSNVAYFLGMFQDTSFNGAIGGWDMSSAVNIGAMFYNDPVFNQDIGDWDISNVTSLNGLFYGNSAFDQDLSSWNVEQVTDMGGMFDGARLSTEHYDALLSSWSAQPVQSGVTFDAGDSTYCAIAARSVLTAAPTSWTIQDGGNVCLTEERPLASRSTIGDAIYTFSVSSLVDTRYEGNTGSYTVGVPGCQDCLVVLDPVHHTLTFRGLRIGDRLDFTLQFTQSNILRIGPSLIIADPPLNGGGAIAFYAVEPSSGSDAPLSFQLQGGRATTTSRLVSLTLAADPRTVRGYVVSLDPTFQKDGIFPLSAASTTTQFLLPETPGTYTVYVKYYSVTGVYSPLLSRTITLLPFVGQEGASYVREAQQPQRVRACLSFAPLSQGARGTRVSLLQKLLSTQGESLYPEKLVTGYFGPATKRAIIRLQERFAAEVLAPHGLVKGTGAVFRSTDALLCRLQKEA